MDGADEALYEAPIINAYIAPSRGGAIVEMDYKPVPYNLCDLLQRRAEGYHLRLTEAAEKKEQLNMVKALVQQPPTAGSSSVPSSLHSSAKQTNGASDGEQVQKKRLG